VLAVAACVVDVLDPASGRAHRFNLSAPAVPLATTDDVALFSPDDGTALFAYRLRDGKVVWSPRGAGSRAFGAGYVTADGTTYLSMGAGARAGDETLSRFDVATGEADVIWSGSGRTLWPQLSTDSTAVLGQGGRLEEAFLRADTAQADTVDTRTGTLRAGQINLVKP